MKKLKLKIFTLIFFLNSSSCFAFSEIKKEDKVFYTNAALAGAVIAYGVAKWDYGKNDYNFGNEGWLGKNAKEGGADKFGHLYTAYLTSRMTKKIYQNWGFKSDEAAWRGALSSFIFTTTMEIGDGFSKYGTSYEDLISNSIGQIAALTLDLNPNFDEKFDIRYEYNPFRATQNDIFTDYNAGKYVFVTKFSGFKPLNQGVMKYLEFHLGYYARGYDKFRDGKNNSRNIYVGIGINLAQVLRDLGEKDWVAGIFNYYQVPYTYVSANHNLN